MACALLFRSSVELALQRYSWVATLLAAVLGAYLCARIVNTVAASAIAPKPALLQQSVGALPRTAQLQYAATNRVTQDQLQPGDLVFFARTYADPRDWITHVGIYIGGGQQINAPTEGQVVSIQPVFSGFWGAHFAAGGRVLRP